MPVLVTNHPSVPVSSMPTPVAFTPPASGANVGTDNTKGGHVAASSGAVPSSSSSKNLPTGGILSVSLLVAALVAVGLFAVRRKVSSPLIDTGSEGSDDSDRQSA
jgi:hypothetical protein